MPSIAIIGASTNHAKFGNKCVRAYAQAGWVVYPVNPHSDIIEGHNAYPTIAKVPVRKLDRISIYLHPADGIKEIEELANIEVGEVWLNPGASSPEIVQRAKELGLNIITECSIVDIGLSPAQFP